MELHVYLYPLRSSAVGRRGALVPLPPPRCAPHRRCMYLPSSRVVRLDVGHVWFVANVSLRLVVRIEELTLSRKVRQSVVS
jgi:hypothetical protein